MRQAGPWFAILAVNGEAPAIETALADQGSASARIAPVDLAGIVADPEVTALIVTAEALSGLALDELSAAIDAQPAWSDLPLLLVASRAEVREFGDTLDVLGQVRIVEAPVEDAILARAAAAALRSRERQRAARAALAHFEEAEARYRGLSETLEQRVSERTKQLESAYERLVREAEERWAAEERLRESEELYRYTVELGRQLVWTAEPDGTIRTVNPRFREITGLSQDVSPHLGWMRSVHPDDLARVLAVWEKAVASASPIMTDFRMRYADGSYRTFRARAAPRFDDQGKIIRWYGTTEDVEEEVRWEAARRAADERYRLAAEATNDAIWDLDVNADSIEWAASSTAFFGYRVDEVDGSLAWWEARVHPEDRERVSESLRDAFDRGDSHWSEAYRFRRADGSYADVFDQGFILRDDQGRARRAVGAMADVSDRHRAEAELRKLQSELIHVSRLSAMGAMASTLAHELNQPLTAVANYVSGSRRLLESQAHPDVPTIIGALKDAESAAQRAGQIVRRIRELVAKGSVTVCAENLPKLISEACAIALVDARLLGISHEVGAAKGTDWVYADRIQIQQVLINLIRNAVQALEDRPERTIRIGAEPKGERWVQVSVRDSGPGLPVGGEEALFEAFSSSKPGGMGIGLSISRTIVEAHGGKIWAERPPEGGACFCFTLPAADETALEDDALAITLPASAPEPL